MTQKVPPKPDKQCYICGANDWWYRPPRWGPGEWLCNRCHHNPNPRPKTSPEPVPTQSTKNIRGNARKVVQSSRQIERNVYSQEVLDLRDRIILGNVKLNVAWDKICQMDNESQEWRDQLERWGQANEKLSALCTQLKAMGYQDCLYLDDQGVKTITCLQQGGIGCLVCPSSIKYWEKEFDEL